MKRIEFGELRVNKEARKHLMEACDTNWISEGPKVAQFEKEWGELFKYKYNIATSSGTDAVLNACLTLYSVGAEPGDEIIVPALSFIATANAVRAAGFTPVFVDVSKQTLNIDATKIEAEITRDTVAIIAVHTMGKLCDMDAIASIANTHDLTLIEDACEAHGASKDGRFVGSWGEIACFSFFIAHIVNSGEGGMVSCFTEKIYETLRSTKCHGRSGDYFDHPNFGLNSKMNDLEASIGLGSLKNFWKTFATRKAIVARMREELDHLYNKVWFSEEEEGEINCPHGFSIVLKEPDKLKRLTGSLEAHNIHWKRNFGCIPTQHRAFNYLEYKPGAFPNAEYIGNNGIHLGPHQYLTEKDVTTIIKAIHEGIE